MLDSVSDTVGKMGMDTFGKRPDNYIWIIVNVYSFILSEAKLILRVIVTHCNSL